MGFFLAIPFFLIRFGLLSVLSPQAVQRAAFFAPLLKQERVAYWVYQAASVAIFLCLFFLHVQWSMSLWFYVGVALYVVGAALLAASVVDFASPSENGVNQSGLYQVSRNPMYMAYFLFFLGCAALTKSLVLLCFVVAFQIAGHTIVRSEERWCLEQFGEPYRAYMKRVRRYF